jgi:hypothetical protein
LQQLKQMVDQQQAAAQPGGPPPTTADAARQQSLARQARDMAQQVSDDAASEKLSQAADAADSASQAIERGDAPKARDAQSLSAHRLGEASELLAQRFRSGPGQTEEADRGAAVANTLLIDVSPDMGRQVRALFDSPKPTAYADQLLEYSTKLRIDASSEDISP